MEQIHCFMRLKRPLAQAVDRTRGKDTTRRATTKTQLFSSAGIRNAIGRSRQRTDSYLVDLRASSWTGLHIRIFCVNRLGIPQDWIANRLNRTQKRIALRILPGEAIYSVGYRCG
nr:hypothetical protein [Desulfobacterales bacterium]